MIGQGGEHREEKLGKILDCPLTDFGQKTKNVVFHRSMHILDLMYAVKIPFTGCLTHMGTGTLKDQGTLFRPTRIWG